MFEFKGTAADSTEASGPEWRVVDHMNIQELGRRPFTTMLLPAHHQRAKTAKTESGRRPSPPIRPRSNTCSPNYTRSQDMDDLLPVATSIYRPTPRISVDRRSLSGRNPHSKGDSLDIFTPKAWIAKGSKLLKRENSKHELTSLRTLDWVEERQDVHPHLNIGPPPPPEFRHSRIRSAGDPNSPSRMNISEPFNFHHITHTQRHHVQKLETANPHDLVSEFSALRASQTSQPELKGIKAKDIQREDLPRDALLPDCPSQLPDRPAGFPSSSTRRAQGSTSDSPDGAMSHRSGFEYSRLPENFSHPNAGYHTAQTSPVSSMSRTSSHQLIPDLIPDFFMFHDESLSDATVGSPIRTESPEPLDCSLGTWNDDIYDPAPPHAVTTDDSADWNRQVPFSMIKTELAPVEEDDETEDFELCFTPRSKAPDSGPVDTGGSSSAKTRYRDSDVCQRVVGNFQDWPSHLIPLAETNARESSTTLEGDDADSLLGHCMLPARTSELSIEDPNDEVPVRSRCISFGPSDIDRFWDLASDAISCSYALGAEGDSNFDWHRVSFHEDEMTAPSAAEKRNNAADTLPKSSDKKPQPDSPFPNRTTIQRSSSVYSSSPPPLLPLQTSPSKLDPPSASSTESSFSATFEAVTPNEPTESAMATRLPAENCKEWCQPAYIVPNDCESQTVQEDLYHQIYTSDYPQDAPFQINVVGRIDGSTISNSPRSSRSPISKSSSQESFWFSQAAFNTRRPRNAGSVGSLPELMSSKNSRERFDPTVDQYTDNLIALHPSDCPSDSQHPCAAQRRRSPNLVKDAAQNIMLTKVKTAEEPLPVPPLSRDKANSDVTCTVQSSSMAPPGPLAPGRRLRSGSSASNLSARGSRGSSTIMPPPPQTTTTRNP